MNDQNSQGKPKENGEQKKRANDKVTLTAEPLKEENQYDLQILRSLRSIVRSIARHSQKLNTDHNLTVPQSICLITVTEKGPLTATEIANQIHVSPSTVVGILDRLEKKQFILRDRSLQDRRRVFITATDKGFKAVKSAPSPMQNLLTEELNKLPKNEKQSIADSLNKIIDLLKRKDLVVEEDKLPLLDTDDVLRS